jgi:hypothetical protein
MNQVSIVQAMYFNHNEHTRPLEDIVMSREKVKSLVTQKHRLTTHCLYIKSGDSEKRVLFYNDNHMFGYKLDLTTSKNQSSGFTVSHVATTSYFPLQVVPREECPSGLIEDFETYEKVFDKDSKIVWSVVELLKELGFDSNGNITRFNVGDRCNWKGQPDRLIYRGYNYSGNGYWHQFTLVDKEEEAIWCEVPDSDIHRIELSKR